MRFESDSILYSATDLVNFLGCAHSTALDIGHLQAPGEPAAEDDEYLELLQAKGIDHERAYLELLRSSGRTIAEIPSAPPLRERAAFTREAMARGDDVIYQGALLAEPWHGYSDFLLRVDGVSSRFGPFAYEVADTKLARSAKPKHVVQLCVYSNMVAGEQGVMPSAMHVVLGSGKSVSLRVPDFLHYCTIASRQFEAFVGSSERMTAAEPCGHCDHCRWSERCGAEWDASEHLSLVANITRPQIAKLRTEGIATMRDLAAIAEGKRIPRMQDETLDRIRAQARLQLGKRDGGANAWELLPLAEGRGFARLPQPDEGDLFFDIEGDPLFEDGGLEYLFGFDHVDDGEVRFTPFWAHTRAYEKKAFQDTIDFIVQRLAAHPGAHVYHYASYEETKFKRLAMFHGTREAEVDDLLRTRKLVDLYKVVREGIRVSEPRYSIKNLEVFYTEKRDGAVASGGDSVVAYERWRALGDPLILQQIADYNEFDCKSTRGCRNWLLALRPAEVAWFSAPAETEKDIEGAAERRQHEEATVSLQDKLLDGVADEERAWRELLGHLLEFHKREAKPEWWAMFNRQEMTTEQLIEDRACLGDLSPDPDIPPVLDKKSKIYTFRFPAQEFKVKVGEEVLRAGTLEAAGKVVSLDDENRRLALRVGPSRPPFTYPLSIIPPGPIGDKVLREGIYRYALAVAAGRQDEFPAVTDLLRGVPGRDQSYSLIQGPPGAGKTYQSSRRIVELLAKGRRVGVASNTHKAINNLLSAIETHAKECGIAFRGVKRSNTPEQCLNSGGQIEDTTDNAAAAAPAYQLVGGTAFLFARPDFDGTLDYLFVDEAGQVSLANIVAMGMSARHLVLVGDQMQLSQPTHGVHPGGSGVSVLEHLLADTPIVPEDRGEFLAVTRRLHPDVCRFISDAVYEGKLEPAEGNDRQRLVLSDGADAEALAPTGIRFVDVEHQDCSQESEEEAERIRQTYESLLSQRWTDRHGVERGLTADDILVVTPYNMQVHRLRETLPAGARVGTVDKFQGQEAAVVLISMVTSSGEDLPRDIAFLFSRNRLNVAISRARCLAVIYASPRLLEVPCRTIDQMRLVNMLCWAKTYAESAMRTSPQMALPRETTKTVI